MEIRKYKIKGLADDHIAQADFNCWMNQKICSKCGGVWTTFYRHGKECSSCQSREPFIERYKWYENNNKGKHKTLEKIK